MKVKQKERKNQQRHRKWAELSIIFEQEEELINRELNVSSLKKDNGELF